MMRFFSSGLRSPIWSVFQLVLVCESLWECRIVVFGVDLAWGIAIVLSSCLYVSLCKVYLSISWPFWRVLLPLVFLRVCSFLCHLIVFDLLLFCLLLRTTVEEALSAPVMLMFAFCFSCVGASFSLLGRLFLGVIVFTLASCNLTSSRYVSSGWTDGWTGGFQSDFTWKGFCSLSFQWKIYCRCIRLGKALKSFNSSALMWPVFVTGVGINLRPLDRTFIWSRIIL